MRKLLLIIVIAILIFSGLGASAVNIENNNTINKKYNPEERATHTVLGEYGTATTCGFCKYAHGALKELYNEGQLDFYYVSLVCDKNNKAYARAKNAFNLYGYPTIWWDGGYRVNVGANSIPTAKTTYAGSINYCGIRSVKSVDINLDVTWLGRTKIKVECKVFNNEPNTYGGTIRVYIVEKESSMEWRDTAGDLYTMAFLDWAFNEPVSIPSGGSWSDSMTWNGQLKGFPSVTKSNTFVIAAVFNDEWHQGYSYPPNNPFDAYYVDDVVGVNVEKININQEIPKKITILESLVDLLQNHNILQPLLQKIQFL